MAEVSTDDLKTIAETARDLAYRQLETQISASDNFDTKALGVLGFEGAALTAILATRDAFHAGSWVLPALLLVLAGVFAVISIQPLAWDDGPDPRIFFDREKDLGFAEGSAARADVDLVSELGGPKGSIAANRRAIHRKAGQFRLALWITMLAGATTAILLGLGR